MNKTIAMALFAMNSAFTFAQNDIIVKGRIDGIESGRLYMIAQTGENKIDTLGTATFKAPNFEIKGSFAEPVMANLVVEKYAGGFQFLAEPNTTYEALLTNGPDFYIRGGKLQDEYTKFNQHQTQMRMQLRGFQERYDKLMAESKFRSASKTNDSLRVLETQIHNETQAFLQQHDDLITAYTVQANALGRNAGLADSERMYASMGPGAKNTVSARIMKERIDRLKRTQQGVPAPDFTLPDLKGNMVTMSKVPGKIKIVDFWASWCGPCRLNNPALKKLYDQYHDKGLEIVSVSLDNKKERWEEAVVKDGLNWVNVSSLKGWKCDVVRLYSVTGVPAIYVLDENNRIIATNLRGEKLKKFLQETFK